ncbi:MAG: hypothetical protein M1396_01095, partial [Chloroflexi bacterium]|nr:hypothetical protein [Chloroflexota bacterium]
CLASSICTTCCYKWAGIMSALSATGAGFRSQAITVGTDHDESYGMTTSGTNLRQGGPDAFILGQGQAIGNNADHRACPPQPTDHPLTSAASRLATAS